MQTLEFLRNETFDLVISVRFRLKFYVAQNKKHKVIQYIEISKQNKSFHSGDVYGVLAFRFQHEKETKSRRRRRE